MAYSRVNWQDKPSTATPVNADNLNKMDKGIADVDISKIDKTDMVQTDTINDPAKVPSSAVTYGLGQEIAQLNNNLAKTSITTTPVAGVTVTASKVFKHGLEVYGYLALNITTQLAAFSEVLSLGDRATINFGGAILLQMYGASPVMVYLGNGTNKLFAHGKPIPVGVYYVQFRGWSQY